MTPAAPPTSADYSDYVNPQWVRLLNLLQMNVRYRRCSGCELFTEDGNVILDFLSGYCVHNTGHNHPAIIQAIKDELDRSGPAMLQSHVPDPAGALARRLCTLAGGGMEKVLFACSGSEGVESAIKFARKRTGRTGLIYAEGAFHGLTCGALSLMGDGFWKDKFGPMLPDTVGVPFGDLAALKRKLSIGRYAASSWSPCNPKPAFACRTATILPRPRSSATGMAPFLCWTKSRPACSEPGPSSRRISSKFSPIWSSSPRR
jgi:ornithine--oxo-acid transaminase